MQEIARTGEPPVHSPNQLQKREVIIQAALNVIRSSGVAACTTRAIAEASPLTKSSIHYYFSDIDVLVDLAMERYSEELVARVRAAADLQPTAAGALEAAVRAYVVPGPTAVPAVWQEYYVMTLRRGDPSALRSTVEPVVRLFEELLAATGDTSPGVSEKITAFLFGVLMLRPTFPIEPDEVVATVRELAGSAHLS